MFGFAGLFPGAAGWLAGRHEMDSSIEPGWEHSLRIIKRDTTAVGFNRNQDNRDRENANPDCLSRAPTCNLWRHEKI
jgi:hypothetical protein